LQLHATNCCLQLTFFIFAIKNHIKHFLVTFMIMLQLLSFSFFLSDDFSYYFHLRMDQTWLPLTKKWNHCKVSLCWWGLDLSVFNNSLGLPSCQANHQDWKISPFARQRQVWNLKVQKMGNQLPNLWSCKREVEKNERKIHNKHKENGRD
jgi:hypothetical protein